jgi:hypothetical protein
MSGNRQSSSTAPGWVVYGCVMMVLIGTFNIIEGVVVLFGETKLVLAPKRLILVDRTGFGWALIIFGVLIGLVGLGLLSARGWSRIAGIGIVGLHAVAQLLWLGAYPLWSLLMLALDVAVLWALTAGWQSAREALADDYEPRIATR